MLKFQGSSNANTRQLLGLYKMCNKCVICGLKSPTLQTESFRPTDTFQMTMTKLCDAMFVPTRHIAAMVEVLAEDNLYCKACVSTIHAALKIQAQISRLDSVLRERAKCISNAIIEATIQGSDGDEKLGAESPHKKIVSPLKKVQNSVIRSYAQAILPIRPCPPGRVGRKRKATNEGIPVAAVLPMRQEPIPVQQEQVAAASVSDVSASSTLLNKNRTQLKEPVKRKLFECHEKSSSTTTPTPSTPTANANTSLTGNGESNTGRRVSTRKRTETVKFQHSPNTNTPSDDVSVEPQSEQPRREVKKCPKCDFKMHFFSPSSELFSYKAHENKKRVELMIIDHYGKHHFAVKQQHFKLDDHGLPSYSCPTCKYKSLPPPSRTRSSYDPAEVKIGAYRSLIRHFLSAHEIY